MLLLSKILLVIAGLFLILDGIFIIADIPNFLNPDWGLPCPLIFIALGLGIILFIFSGASHHHRE